MISFGALTCLSYPTSITGETRYMISIQPINYMYKIQSFFEVILVTPVDFGKVSKKYRIFPQTLSYRKIYFCS